MRGFRDFNSRRGFERTDLLRTRNPQMKNPGNREIRTITIAHYTCATLNQRFVCHKIYSMLPLVRRTCLRETSAEE
jgi:hypothetical protein